MDIYFSVSLPTEFIMNHITPKVAVFVWFFLIIATLTIAWLVDSSEQIGDSTIVLLLFVAAIKSHLLIHYFMEVKWADRSWQLAFGIWVWLVFSVLALFWTFNSMLVYMFL